ncbi:MAG TPA: hypothetical protein PLC99_20970 [Verrucomicrobiota bacterium]|nr:hypothetical protein [Verrucomicrobiota bacterium]
MRPHVSHSRGRAIGAHSDGAQWHTEDGVPMPSVLSATGGARPTTLSDARELGLLPSVSNILEVVHLPEQEVWKQGQAVLLGLTLPRREGESVDAYLERVMEARSQAAVGFGTKLHGWAERLARWVEVDPADPRAPWMRLLRAWFLANCVRVVWAERPLVNRELGYAGVGDLLIEHRAHGITLVDLKLQNVKEGEGPSTYRSWGYEMAAYRAALGEKVVCVTLIMNSREAHAPIEGRWSEEQMEMNWRGFRAARELWVVANNYDPTQKREAETGKAEMGVSIADRQ